MKRVVWVASAATALIAVPGAASATTAARTPTPIVRSHTVAAPFNLDVHASTVYVADGGLNLVGTLTKGGSIAPVAKNQPGASGVALSGDSRYLAFTTTVTDEATFENTRSGVWLWGPRGSRTFVNTLAYEKRHNPDKVNHYGIDHPSACVRKAFQAAGFPVSYKGLVDSHAYSVAAVGNGWVVADAGSNTLWSVSRSGAIRTLSVLPPQPTVVTAGMASALGLPSCVAGVRYAFEAVPTDVEVGRDGYLYVTTLPGGPESPVLGARGAVYKVDPRTGKSSVVATGFLGATNLAIGNQGQIYVAELFAGKISVVRHGRTSTFVSLPGVVAVESGRSGAVWAGTLGDETSGAPGTIVEITRGGAKHTAAVLTR
ncbi:conserved exported hypothetical protein [Nostocoides japonicum T1-X7]|uniref:ScyD/ScyE family protein n=1 Tax=Nostocoides japonicum T1-X7 TaxID=1194083 RepID=A0A077M5Y6_9MICO|nr:ScyD/ScyE family protein [Tetrasphaera japonica]CCH80467.1 conserved exported hypothetical protein [Tetrasphaera japonica T1-X7]